MPVLRVILVMVPPLLADLIRHVVAPRLERHQAEQLARGIVGAPLVEFSFAADVSDMPQAQVDSPEPHVIILGPMAAASLGAAPLRLRNVRVLTLSADLTRVEGPEAGVGNPLTPDVLADLLLAISRTI